MCIYQMPDLQNTITLNSFFYTQNLASKEYNTDLFFCPRLLFKHLWNKITLLSVRLFLQFVGSSALLEDFGPLYWEEGWAFKNPSNTAEVSKLCKIYLKHLLWICWSIFTLLHSLLHYPLYHSTTRWSCCQWKFLLYKKKMMQQSFSMSRSHLLICTLWSRRSASKALI